MEENQGLWRDVDIKHSLCRKRWDLESAVMSDVGFEVFAHRVVILPAAPKPCNAGSALGDGKDHIP